MLRVILILMLLSISAPALSDADFAGLNELSLHGSLDYQGPNGDNIDLRIGYGRFLRDEIMLGFNFQWSLIEDIAPGEGDYRAQQAGVELHYLFADDDPLVPYVGIEAGMRNVDFGDVDESGLVLGASAGTRYFLNRAVAIDVSLRILTSSKDLFVVDFEAERQYVVPAIGIRAVF